MTAFTLNEAAALALGRVGAAGHGTGHGGGWNAGRVPPTARHRGAPVRRDSSEADTFEQEFFAVPGRGETDRLLRMARAALDAGRRLKRAARHEGRQLSAAERALAGLTAGAVRVFEELCTLARLNAGRVFPSYDHLARATALGRATVARALGSLETAGFLVRRRRFRRIAGEGAGPRYAQTSNVYRPTLPTRVLGLLPRWLRPAPVPDDAAQHAAERRRDVAAMHARLSCRELAEATLGGPLGRALARLGTRLDAIERESQDDAQSLPESFKQGIESVTVGRSVTNG